jgi:hypothetical protein
MLPQHSLRLPNVTVALAARLAHRPGSSRAEVGAPAPFGYGWGKMGLSWLEIPGT